MMDYFVMVHYIKSQWNKFESVVIPWQNVGKSKGAEYLCKGLYMETEVVLGDAGAVL